MKKLLILLLSAALVLTLGSTNPDIGDFILYYEEGAWMEEEALFEKLPAELDALKEKASAAQQNEIRTDYYIASLYRMGGQRFLGIAGDFYLLDQ